MRVQRALGAVGACRLQVLQEHEGGTFLRLTRGMTVTKSLCSIPSSDGLLVVKKARKRVGGLGLKNLLVKPQKNPQFITECRSGLKKFCEWPLATPTDVIPYPLLFHITCSTLAAVFLVE
jgi:hypothetical protein